MKKEIVGTLFLSAYRLTEHILLIILKLAINGTKILSVPSRIRDFEIDFKIKQRDYQGLSKFAFEKISIDNLYVNDSI